MGVELSLMPLNYKEKQNLIIIEWDNKWCGGEKTVVPSWMSEIKVGVILQKLWMGLIFHKNPGRENKWSSGQTS